MVGQVENGLSLLFAQYPGRNFLLVGIVVGNSIIYYGLRIFGNHRYLADKVRDVVRFRQNQHHLDITLGGQYPQQFLQLIPGLSIQSDKRVVHDEQFRIGKQRLCQLELPQFTTRECDDILVEELLHVEQLVQVGLQSPAFRGILTRQPIGLFQQFTHRRSFVVDVMLVPTQLQVILSVYIHTIRIREGDIAYPVRGQLFA